LNLIGSAHVLGRMTKTRIGFPHLASTLALIVALGSGGAYAAGLAKNSVTSKQIKNGTITAQDVKKSALTGAQVKDGSLTAADLAPGAVGKVPLAANVDTVQHLVASPASGQQVTMLTKGALTLTGVCTGSSPNLAAVLRLSTSADNSRWVSTVFGDQDFDVADGPADIVTGNTGMARFNLSALSEAGAGLEVTGFANGGTSCRLDVVVLG
jgi:hypothetical protein